MLNVEMRPHIRFAFAERASRMEALRAAVVGTSISGEHDPAHCLLDKACQMYETNTFKHLDLAKCVSRTLEIQGTTKNRELTFERGSLVLKNQDDKLVSSTNSEIKVHYAMIRRGRAFQFAKLMSHEHIASGKRFFSSRSIRRHHLVMCVQVLLSCFSVTKQLLDVWLLRFRTSGRQP